jgi:hypothetical protein
MQPFMDPESARWLHATTVARVEREGHRHAHRDEYERLGRRERTAVRPRQRGWRFAWRAGLRRLRLA